MTKPLDRGLKHAAMTVLVMDPGKGIPYNTGY